MVRRTLRFAIRVGLLIGLVLAVRRLWHGRAQADGPAGDWSDRSWQPPSPPVVPPPSPAPVATTPPVPAPPSPPAPAPTVVAPPPPPPAAPAVAAAPAPPAAAPAAPAPLVDADRIWVEPVGTTCPASHPIKVKLASRLFHVPGMFAYERTRPDRCYADEADAIAEGFSRAKR